MDNLKAQPQTQRYAMIAALCLVAIYFFNLGLPSVWNPNEAFYAEAPREMQARGDMLTPYFNYETRFQKPPLMYWLVYASQAAIGLNEAAPRVVSALFAAVGVLITYLLAMRVLGRRRPAWLAAAFVAGALDYNTAARFGSPEMLVTVLTIAATGAFYVAYTNDELRAKRVWYATAYAVAGFAALAKGPIGLILPLLVMGAVILADRRWAEIKYIASPAGIALFVLIAAPWYIYMIQTHGEAFTSVAFGENIGRFTSRKSGTSSIFFYFGSVPASFLPGSVLMLGAMWWAAFNRSEAWRRLRFPIIWALSVFVFFSISKSKLPTYVYSMFAPLAIFTASWVDDALDTARWRRVMGWLSALICATVLGGVIWLAYVLTGFDATAMACIAAMAGLFGYAAYGAVKKRSEAALGAALASTVALYLVFTLVLMPKIESYREYRQLGRAIEQAEPSGKLDLNVYGIYQEGLTYYAKRKVVRTRPDVMYSMLNDKSAALVLMDASEYDASFAPLGYKVYWRGKLYRYSESRLMVYLGDLKAGRLKEFVLFKTGPA